MRFRERPAVVRKIVAWLEIDGIQRQAIATPMVGRAAEKAEPAHRQIVKRRSDTLALVEFLRVLIEFHAAAFEERHPKRCVDEFAGESDARGTRTHDAHVGLDGRSGRNATRIDDHSHPAIDDPWSRLREAFLGDRSAQPRGRQIVPPRRGSPYRAPPAISSRNECWNTVLVPDRVMTGLDPAISLHEAQRDWHKLCMIRRTTATPASALRPDPSWHSAASQPGCPSRGNATRPGRPDRPPGRTPCSRWLPRRVVVPPNRQRRTRV